VLGVVVVLVVLLVVLVVLVVVLLVVLVVLVVVLLVVLVVLVELVVHHVECNGMLGNIFLDLDLQVVPTPFFLRKILADTRLLVLSLLAIPRKFGEDKRN